MSLHLIPVFSLGLFRVFLGSLGYMRIVLLLRKSQACRTWKVFFQVFRPERTLVNKGQTVKLSYLRCLGLTLCASQYLEFSSKKDLRVLEGPLFR